MSAIIPMPLLSRSPLERSFGSRGLFDGLPGLGRSILDELADVYGQSGITVKSLDDSIAYSFNLAGYEEDEISVKADPKNNMLYISAVHNDDTGSARQDYSYPLGEERVSADRISKSYRNGLLTITVKNADSGPSETFEVQAAADPEGHTLTAAEDGSDLAAGT